MTKVDIVLIPSHFEGVPLVFLESVYFGRKFLINDLLCLKEYEIPEVFRVKMKSPNIIVQKILQLMRMDCEEQLQKIRNTVVQKHANEVFRESVAEIFDVISENLKRLSPQED